MANQEVKGANVGLYVDVSGTQTLVAAKQGLDFEESMDTIDVGHSDNFGWMERIAGQQEFSVSWDGIMLLDDGTGSFAASHQRLRQAKRQGEIVTLEIRYPFGGPTDQGQGLVTTVTLTAPYDGAATIAADIESVGAVQFA